MEFEARFVSFYVATKWITRTGVSMIFEMEFKVRIMFDNIGNGTVSIIFELWRMRIFLEIYAY